MELIEYEDRYQEQVIRLILSIQNDEAGIDLSLAEQPDLLDIRADYIDAGGGFWLMLEEGRVIGTIGLMPKENRTAVLKKSFVDADYRSQKVGLALYLRLLAFAEEKQLKYIILDTPSVAKASHRFYARAGFRRITKEEPPVPYDYPDRDSLLYLLELNTKEKKRPHQTMRVLLCHVGKSARISPSRP